MRHITHVLHFLVLATALDGCGGAPKQASSSGVAPRPASTESDPIGAEWLYVTAHSNGARGAECLAVKAALEDEATCHGRLCQPASRLAQDWLRACQASSSTDERRVRELHAALRRRATEAPSECESKIEPFLRGCSEGAECVRIAQQWATTCGHAYGTPLVVQIVETNVARGAELPRVTLDLRTCQQRFDEWAKAPPCSEAECAQAYEALEDYRSRCETPNQPVPLTQAIATQRRLIHMRPAAPPVPVMEERIDPGLHPGVTKDRRGIVLAVGERDVTGARQYADLIHDSDAIEEVLTLRVFPATQSAFEVRVGVLDAEDDVSFFARYPKLRIPGQDAAVAVRREPEALQALAKAREWAKGEPARALVELLSALGEPEALDHTPTLKRELIAADATLEPAFGWLGRQKAEALHTLSDEALVPAARRTARLPLSDINSQGQVELAAEPDAVLFDLDALLPQSGAAYRLALNEVYAKTANIVLAPATQARLERTAAQTLELCAAAQHGIAASRRFFLDCGFGFRECTETTRDEEGARLSRQLLEVRTLQVRSRLQLAVLDEGSRLGQTTAAKRCLARR